MKLGKGTGKASKAFTQRSLSGHVEGRGPLLAVEKCREKGGKELGDLVLGDMQVQESFVPKGTGE